MYIRYFINVFSLMNLTNYYVYNIYIGIIIFHKEGSHDRGCYIRENTFSDESKRV